MRLPSDDISCRLSQLAILRQILIELKLSKQPLEICWLLACQRHDASYAKF
jgi:hypothetical protein